MAKTTVLQAASRYITPLADRMRGFGIVAATRPGGLRVRQVSSTLRADHVVLADA